jgi:hypothetical protein
MQISSDSKFQIDFSVTYIHGPKQRSPWITLNGKHMGDTELIIDFLNESVSFSFHYKASLQ